MRSWQDMHLGIAAVTLHLLDDAEPLLVMLLA